MKILIVDDDVVARMMLMHLVDACGAYEIVEAEDGEQAWQYLQQPERPALVFCDLRMPRLSGMELLARVRASAQLASLPLVLVSAATDAVTRDEALAKGASGFIVKPLHDDSVRELLARICALPEAGDETLEQAAARLGIDAARLTRYLEALGQQIETAQQELPLADPATRAARLERLRSGCATLGLHGAARQLDGLLVEPGAPGDAFLQALDAVAQKVARRLAHQG